MKVCVKACHCHASSDGQVSHLAIVPNSYHEWNAWVHRLDLLQFFKQECEERGACIVYATHIFDGLAPWITHIAYMEDGKLLKGAVVSACLRCIVCPAIGCGFTIVRLCAHTYKVGIRCPVNRWLGVELNLDNRNDIRCKYSVPIWRRSGYRGLI